MNFYIGISIVLLFSLSSQARNFGGIAGSPVDSGSLNDTDLQNSEQSQQQDASSINAGDSSDPTGNGLVSPWSEWMKLKAPPAAFLKPKKKTFPFVPVQPVSSAEELAANSPWAQWTKLKTATAAAAIPSFSPAIGATPAAPNPAVIAAGAPWAAWTSIKAPAFAVQSPGIVPSESSIPSSPVVAPWTAWAQLKTATAAGNVPSISPAASLLSSKALLPKEADILKSENGESVTNPMTEAPYRPATMEEYLPPSMESNKPVTEGLKLQPSVTSLLNSWPVPLNAPSAYFSSVLYPNDTPRQSSLEPLPPILTPPIVNPPYTLNPYVFPAPVPAPPANALQPESPPFPFPLAANAGMYPPSPYFAIPADSALPTPPKYPGVASDVNYDKMSSMGLPLIPQPADTEDSTTSSLLQEEEALEPALLEYLKTLGIKVPEASLVAVPTAPSIPPPANPFLPAATPFVASGVSPAVSGIPTASKNVSSSVPLEAAEEKLLVKWAKKIFELQKNNSWVPTTKTSVLEKAWAEWVSLHNNATANITATPVGLTDSTALLPPAMVEKESLVAWLKKVGAFPLETKKMAELVKWIEEIEKPAESPLAPAPEATIAQPIPQIPTDLISSVSEILSKAPPAEKAKIAAWITANNLTIPKSPTAPASAPPGLTPSAVLPESIFGASATEIPPAITPGAVPALPLSPIPPTIVEAVNFAFPTLPPEQKLQIAQWAVENNVTLSSEVAAPPKPVPVPTLLPSTIPPSVISVVEKLYPTAPVDTKLQIATWMVANNVTLPPAEALSVPPPITPALAPIAPSSSVPTLLNTSTIPQSVITAVNTIYPAASPEKKLEIVSWIVANNISTPSLSLSSAPANLTAATAPSVIPISPSILTAINTMLPTATPEKKLEIASWIVTNNISIPSLSPVPSSLAPANLSTPPSLATPIPPSVVTMINTIYPKESPEKKLEIASWIVANNISIPSLSLASVPANLTAATVTPLAIPIPPSIVQAINTMYPTESPEKKLEIASWIVANNISIPALSPVPSSLTPANPTTPPSLTVPIPPSVVTMINTMYPTESPEKKLEIASWLVANNISVPSLSPTEVPSEIVPPSIDTSIPPSVVETVKTLYPTAAPEKQLEIASWIVANNISLTSPLLSPTSPLPGLTIPSELTVTPEIIKTIPPSLVEAVNTAYPTLSPEQKLQVAIEMMKSTSVNETIITPPALATLPGIIPQPPLLTPPALIPPEGIAPQIPPAVVKAVETLYPTAPVEKKLQIATWMVTNNITLPSLPAPEVTSMPLLAPATPTESPLPTYLAAIQEILPTLPEESKTAVETWLAANNISLPRLEADTVLPIAAPVGYLPPPMSPLYSPVPPQVIVPEKLAPFKAEIEEILLHGPPDIISQLITWLIANNASVAPNPLSPAFPTPLPVSSYPTPPWMKYLNPATESPVSPYTVGITENPLMLPPLENLSPDQFKEILQQVLDRCNKSNALVSRSSNSRPSDKNRKSHHRNVKKEKSVEDESSSEEEINKTEEGQKVVSAMRRALYPTVPQTQPAAGVSKPSQLDFVPQEFWDMVPTVAPNTSLVDPGYWAAKKSMFISKLFDALARVTLNYTNSATSTTTEDPKQQLIKKMDTQLLSNAARSVKEESGEEESAETSTDDEDLVSSKEPENLPKEPENPLHKLFKFGVQKTILSDLSTTPSPNDQPFREPLTTPPPTVAPKSTPNLDEQKQLLDKLKSVLNHAKKTHRKAVKKQKSKPKKSRGSTTTTESPIDFEALAKALLVQPSK